MTEQELAKFLEDNREAVMKASRDAIIEKIKDSMKWSLPDAVHQTVTEFLKTEIAPEVGKMLVAEKEMILGAARKSAAALSNTLAEKMMLAVTTNLDGYRAEEVFKALLGIKGRGY